MKFLHWFTYITLGMTAIFTVMMSYWLLRPYDAVYVENDPVILTPVVKAGEVVVYKTTICKYKDIPVEVSKTLVNNIFISFTPYSSNIGIGCHTKEVYTEIPEYAPKGKYFIRIINTYKVNPVRTDSYEYRTGEFEII